MCAKVGGFDVGMTDIFVVWSADVGKLFPRTLAPAD
jgi:hypothetical protein